MLSKLKLSASAAALALLVGAGASPVKAADIVEPGCTLSGSVMAGYMYNWQSSEFTVFGTDVDGLDIDWDTPFGEGAGLVTCGEFNIQADVAYYAHSGDVDDDFSDSDVDIDQTNTHIGGALFYRDPQSWAGGLQASWISQDVFGIDIDIFRVGLFGEIYLGDSFTLGGNAAYYSTDLPDTFNKDDDGFELALWGRFYVTPDFALTLRGDLELADIEFSGGGSADRDGYAITGDGEYLVWDQGLSLFAGARYAERDYDDNDFDTSAELDDFQIFAGIKFYFGQAGTLIERQRTGTVDNTSVFKEKLPNFLLSQQEAFPRR